MSRTATLLLPILTAGCVSVPHAVYPDAHLPPTSGTVAHASAQRQTVSIVAGGAIPAAVVDTTCRGYVREAPDLSVNNATLAGIVPLRISVTASLDTTLLVRAPDGTWTCDDDGGGGLNPAIRINGPINGQYDIWVGTLSLGTWANSIVGLF